MSAATEKQVKDCQQFALAAWLAGADAWETKRVIDKRFKVNVQQLPLLWQLLNLDAQFVPLAKNWWRRFR